MSGIIDIVMGWLGDSPGSPRFAQPFKGVAILSGQDFGDKSSPGKMYDSVTVKIPVVDGSVKTPANGKLIYIPNLDSIAGDEKAAIAARWPELRLLDGSRYRDS